MAAASYSDLYIISTDQAFQGRVLYALYAYTDTVLTEVNTTAWHTIRVALSRQVLAGNYAIGSQNLQSFVLAILTISQLVNEAILANKSSVPSYSIPDADILSAVTIVWNYIAGFAS